MKASVLLGALLFLGAAACLCSAQQSPCESMPCQNGGVCQATSRGFTCRCKIGFYGTYCSKHHSTHCKYMNKTYPTGLFRPKPCIQCLCVLGRVMNCTKVKCNQTVCATGPCNGTCRMIGGVSTCIPNCPKGVPNFHCFAPPCKVTNCTSFPKAVCVNNYCGGCKADFYQKGKRVNCSSSTAKPPTPSSSVNKTGFCPRSNSSLTLPSCSSECRMDSTCMGRMKCCRSSCGGMHCACPILLCRLRCRNGYARDKNGCRICACANKTPTLCQKYSNLSTPLITPGPKLLPGMYRPNCTGTGNFTVVQCPQKSDPPPFGCFCVNPTTGVPIYGWIVQKKSTGKLYCSRKPKNLTFCQYVQQSTPIQPPRRGRRSLPLPGSYHPTCTKTGNFTAVQCVQTTPIFNLSNCFCVNPVSGFAQTTLVVKMSKTGQKYCALKTTMKPTCSPVKCRMYCQYGFQKNASGCEICKCNPGPATTVPPATCSPIACLIFCPFGYEKDAQGCRKCKCKSAPATTALTAAPVTTAATTCTYQKKVYSNGQNFSPTPCQRCICASGRVHCAVVDCPPPSALPCTQPVKVPGRCCPICNQTNTPRPATTQPGCIYNGKKYADGANFFPKPCINCTCVSGSVTCRGPQCPPISCSYPIKLPGQCCATSCSGVIPTTSAAPPTTCKPIACLIYCRYGYQKDAHGCNLCRCAPAPPTTCKPIACLIYCRYGYQKDAHGCNMCRCASAPVTTSSVTTAASAATAAEVTRKATTTKPSEKSVTNEMNVYDVAFEVQSTESAITAVLTVERKRFSMFLTTEFANRYGLADDNVQNMLVTKTKSPVRVLIAFQLKPTTEHGQSEIMKVKEQISNDVDGSRIKFAFSTEEKEELEFESYAIDSSGAQQGAKNPDKSSDSGLSTPALVAIAVGAGLGTTALIVLIILALKNGKGRRIPYDQNPASMSFDNTTYSLSSGSHSGNSINPTFDQPLYDGDTQPILKE